MQSSIQLRTATSQERSVEAYEDSRDPDDKSFTERSNQNGLEWLKDLEKRIQKHKQSSFKINSDSSNLFREVKSTRHLKKKKVVLP